MIKKYLKEIVSKKKIVLPGGNITGQFFVNKEKVLQLSKNKIKIFYSRGTLRG
jgi:hypothetical protein